MTVTAEELRRSRSKHLLTSYEAAVKQFAAFREATPITEKKFPSSGSWRKRTVYSSKKVKSSIL